MYRIIKKGIAMNIRHLRGFLLGQNLFFNATAECFDIVDRMIHKSRVIWQVPGLSEGPHCLKKNNWILETLNHII